MAETRTTLQIEQRIQEATVWIVDDDAGVAQSFVGPFRYGLKIQNIQLFTSIYAGDLAVAASRAVEQSPDIVIMDYHLGNRIGAEVIQQMCRIFQERGFRMPIFILNSAIEDSLLEKLPQELMAQGIIQECVKKPIGAKDFQRLIESHLRQRFASGE
jgi:response regulator RpfG family c-di-GMP phosphodiesterase